MYAVSTISGRNIASLDNHPFLFMSDNHVVKASLFEGDAVFVTFQSATQVPGVHRPGFGEGFLRKREISAVHVIPSQSAWYQHPEILDICHRIKKAVSGYKRVITYGSSMGGYAAINFAHLVGATDVIALSPQFTIDPNRAPEDVRYRMALPRMPDGFVYDQPAGIDWSTIRVNLLYDPYDRGDDYQVSLARAEIPAHEIRMEHATHPVTAVLGIESLKSFLLAYPSNPEKACSEVSRAYQQDKEKSWHYWLSVAKKAGRSPDESLAAARTAIQINPAHPAPYLVEGNLLLIQKKFGAALRPYNRAAELNRKMAEPYLGKARAFIGLRLWGRATASLNEARKRRGSAATITALERQIAGQH